MAYTAKSTELTNIDASPVVRMKMVEAVGAFKTFSYTVPVGDLALNSTVELLRFEIGQKPLWGVVVHEDVGNNIALGDGTTEDLYKASTSIGSAGSFTFFDLIAKKHGEIFTVNTSLVATVKTGAWTAGKKIAGYVILGGGGI